MGNHVVLNVDRLLPSETQKIEGSSNNKQEEEKNITSEEKEPLIQILECRICQEEDHIKNLEVPCACSGSLKYAHRGSVQRWCNEKGDITCEICHEAYKPDYTATPRLNPDEATIDISGGWNVTGTLDLHDPRVLAIAAAQRHFLEAEYDEYASADASGVAFCRSAALILMALLLLRHALSMSSSDEEDDASEYFSLILLRAVGFLLPFYIMAWAVSIVQRHRQRQEGATLAASDVAFILQPRQGAGLQITIAPDTPTTPQQEPQQK